MAEPIISVSGLRGVVGETLTPEVAIRYAAAFAATLPPGHILIGRDSRPSGKMLSLAVQAGLQAVGRATIDAGIIATPTAGVLLRRFKAAGAIQITASHNPAPYNGLKLFSADGRVIPAAPGREVLHRYRTASPDWLPQDRLGGSERCDDSVTAHLLAVLDTVDAERIRQRRFRVLLDSNHGAGSILGRRLLHELACRVTVLGEEPNGQFAHPAEPTAENLAGVLTAVANAGADIGFCQDPDADRLAVIDASGRYLGEEYTLAMCVDHVLRCRAGILPAQSTQGAGPSAPQAHAAGTAALRNDAARMAALQAARLWPIAPAAGCRKTWPSDTACRISDRRWARRTSSMPCSPTARFSAGKATAGRSTREWATSATAS